MELDVLEIEKNWVFWKWNRLTGALQAEFKLELARVELELKFSK